MTNRIPIIVNCPHLGVDATMSIETTTDYVSSRVFPEGDYWRWEITGARGETYVDGGNFTSAVLAEKSLREVLTSN